MSVFTVVAPIFSLSSTVARLVVFLPLPVTPLPKHTRNSSAPFFVNIINSYLLSTNLVSSCTGIAITGDHSKQDQILLVKIDIYIYIKVFVCSTVGPIYYGPPVIALSQNSYLESGIPGTCHTTAVRT